MRLMRGTVLVVDDEATIRQAIQRGLEKAGYEVLAASDGQDALEQMAQREIEVMLLDMKMPGLSGMDVLERVTAEYPDTVVVMQTAVGDVRIAVSAIQAGAYDYVLKPFRMDDLALHVQRALDRRHLVLQARRHQEEIEQKVREQTERLQTQFAEVIQGLAREHALALEVAALTKGHTAKGLFSKLPAELQKPKASVEEFAQALLTVIQQGRLGQT